MRGFIARTLITGFGLWIADALLAGVHFDGVAALWLSALLLGIVNAFIRPLVILLTLPITLLTLGLFLLIVNGAMIMLVAAMLESFVIESLGAAVIASIVVGLTGWAANGFVSDQARLEIWTQKKR